MAERHRAPVGTPADPVSSHHASAAEEYDREVNVRAIVLTGLALAAVMLLAVLSMWWLFRGTAAAGVRRDRPRSPLPEAQQRVLPPEPRLQADPALDMQEFRVIEEKLLTQPEWVDQGRGTARIPIDLAMEVLAREGLPTAGTGAAAQPGAAGRTGAAGQLAAGAPGQPPAAAGAPNRPPAAGSPGGVRGQRPRGRARTQPVAPPPSPPAPAAPPGSESLR